MNKRTQEAIKTIRESLDDNPNPFKTFLNLLVGKNGLWINATARSEMRNARILKEMNLSNKELSKLLDDKNGFVRDLIDEMNPFTGKQKTINDDAFRLAKILVE